MSNLLLTYRRKRAIKRARQGVSMLHAAMHDAHLTRAERRRILRECQSGQLDPSTLIGGDSR